MHVRFWFDPACPFCWITSRWLVRVAGHRDLSIEWSPISLLMKNGTREGEPYFAEVTASHGMLRTVEALRADGHADRIGALYTELGRALHVEGTGVDLRALLTGLGLDDAFAAAADDDAHDAAIRASMDQGLALVGDAVGTPIIAVARPDGGDRIGLFGPVITELPDVEGSLRLWDGFLAMVATDGFFELKRTRSAAPARLTHADLNG